MNTSLPPDISDRFQFAQTLGFGGMATVYRAFDTVTQRDVAIKVLHPHLRQNPIITQHFRQEYTIAQTLEHPNIVRIHSIIDTPQMLALVMELHGTHDLKEHLQHHGKMDHHQVTEIANQILSALEAAHALNIIHHDIKPHNILWDTTTNTAKLIDFGLAQLDQITEHSTALARPESAMATVEYTAPEQFDDFGTDARTDLYSLAITLFELLANTLPYRADSAAAIIQMHQNAPIADVRVFVRATPDHIAETLLRAMAKAPEDRFENATQMREALLREALSGKSQTTRHIPAHSTQWDDLKTHHRTQLVSSKNQQNQLQKTPQNVWNLYLTPRPYTNIFQTKLDKSNHQPQTQFIQAFVRLFQKHPTNYHGDINLNAPKSLGGIDITNHVGPIDDFYQTLFSKDKTPLQFSSIQKTWAPIPLACGMTFEQAESIRHELGNAGISAKRFRLDMDQTSNQLATHWKRLERLRELPKYLQLLPLFAITAISIVTVSIAAAEQIPVLFTITLFVWLFLFARASFSFALNKFATTEHFPRPELIDPTAYHLQFNTRSTTTPQSTFLQDIHATTYLQLRSPRIQNTFERIILTLLELHQTNQENTRNILTQSTTIATHITHLETQLAHQNYPALFEQLARIDTQISHATTTHQTAELILQKSTLRTQLDQIDTDRLELKTLAHQLSTIAQQLQN